MGGKTKKAGASFEVPRATPLLQPVTSVHFVYFSWKHAYPEGRCTVTFCSRPLLIFTPRGPSIPATNNHTCIVERTHTSGEHACCSTTCWRVSFRAARASCRLLGRALHFVILRRYRKRGGRGSRIPGTATRTTEPDLRPCATAVVSEAICDDGLKRQDVLLARELDLAPIPQGKTTETTGDPGQVTVEVFKSCLCPSHGTRDALDP